MSLLWKNWKMTFKIASNNWFRFQFFKIKFEFLHNFLNWNNFFLLFKFMLALPRQARLISPMRQFDQSEFHCLIFLWLFLNFQLSEKNKHHFLFNSVYFHGCLEKACVLEDGRDVVVKSLISLLLNFISIEFITKNWNSWLFQSHFLIGLIYYLKNQSKYKN